MDEAMSVSVADMVISDLTTMYGNEPTFDSGKIDVIVNKVIEVALKEGFRTKDIANYGAKEVCSCERMGSVIAEKIAKL